MNISDITINRGGGEITLPAQAVKLDGLPLRVLVRLACDDALRASYSDAADDAARELGFDRASLDRAVTELAEKGFVACSVKYGGGASAPAGAAPAGASPAGAEKAPPQNGKPAPSQAKQSPPSKRTPAELPDYAGAELAELLVRDSGKYGQLIDECQRALGRIFTGSETSKLVALCDFMGLEPEFVLLVCAYCAGKGKNSVRYAERTACLLVDEGVDNAAKLEDYIKRRERYSSLESRLRSMLGMGDRATTKKESDFFKRWIDEWRFGEDIIGRAYEITVERTDRAALPYLDKILENWHSSGYTTLDEITAAEEKRKAEKEASPDGVKSSFDTDEFFELALKRSYARMNAETPGRDPGGAAGTDKSEVG